MRLGESWSIRCAIMTSRFSEVGKSDHAVIKRSKYQLINDCAMLHVQQNKFWDEGRGCIGLCYGNTHYRAFEKLHVFKDPAKQNLNYFHVRRFHLNLTTCSYNSDCFYRLI